MKRLLWSALSGAVLAVCMSSSNGVQAACNGLCPDTIGCPFIGCNITQYEKDPITGKVTPVEAECFYDCGGIQGFLL